MVSPLPINSKLNSGRYLILEVLGQGGFGITYRAEDTHLHRQVAIKELCVSTMMNRDDNGTDLHAREESLTQAIVDQLRTTEREADLLAGFRHPNIVQVFDRFEENNTSYIVMEFLSGQTLEAFLREDGPMDASAAVKLLIPVMQAMASVHRRGVLHHDIAPDNLLLRENTGGFSPVLIDFGAATVMGDSANAAKMGYAPVEQYYPGSRQEGCFTDVYAMSAVLYRAVTGKVPDPSLDRSLLEDNLQPPSALGITIPDAMEQCIMKGLAVDPEDRYQSFSEMVNALNACLTQPIPQPVSEPVQPPKKRISPAVWIVPVLAVAALIFFMLRTPIFAPPPDSDSGTDGAATAVPLTETPEVTSVPTDTPAPVITEEPATPAPTGTPVPDSYYVSLSVAEIGAATRGDIVTFGRFEQDNNTDNGKEPIEWYVIKHEDDRVTLFSRYVLFPRVWCEASVAMEWNNSPLKDYLNDTFLTTAFTSHEQAYLADEGLGRVYLVTEEEANNLTNDEQTGIPTAYAIGQGIEKNSSNTAWYWTRTLKKEGSSMLYVRGKRAGTGYTSLAPNRKRGGVRPVIQIKLTNE